MRIIGLPDGTQVYHSLRESTVPALNLALRGKPVVAALGPIYERDPAEEVLAPFRRSALETNWEPTGRLAPEWAWERAREIRRSAVAIATLFPREVEDLVEWTRAGLVLEIARVRGIHVKGRGVLHVSWRLRGTVTGRFGADSVRGPDWSFNPLTLGPDDRWRVRASEPGRVVSVLDFRAMDLCSMASLVPGLAERYAGAADPHLRTTEIVYGEPSPEIRDALKTELFVHAYGGESALRRELSERLPELQWLRSRPHGEGARLVQTQSALAFRAALSRALPLLAEERLVPMFAVHDEVALDHSESDSNGLALVARALEDGATERIGVPYRVGVSTGGTYEDAKKG